MEQTALQYFWKLTRFMFSSLFTFDIIVFGILILATIAAAWKVPDKIRSIGKIAIVMFFISLIISLLSSYSHLDFNPFQVKMIDDLTRITATIIVAACTYIFNNIIYIIRTPRL